MGGWNKNLNPKEKKVDIEIVNNETEQEEAINNLQELHAKTNDRDCKFKYFGELANPKYQKTSIEHLEQQVALPITLRHNSVKSSMMANFDIMIESKIIEKAADNVSKIYLDLKIRWQDKILPLRIDFEDFSNLQKIIVKKYPQCIIYEYMNFNNLMAEKYGIFENSSLPVNIIYLFGGWTKEQGKLIFLNNARKNVESNLSLFANVENAKNFLTYFMNVSSSPSKLIIILLYAMYAYFAVFYDILKIDGLRSLLYVSAPTGTGKTSLIKIVSSAILEEDTKPLLRFDDTLASLEESLANSLDRITLIDDFYAKGTKWDDNSFKSKASAITRIIGDGMIRGKMGANRKPREDRKYRGGIIATGEFIDLNTFSSYLRCWIVNFKNGEIYFNDYLSELQQSPILAKSFFSLWIQWLEVHQEFILNTLPAIHQKILSQKIAYSPKMYPRLRSNLSAFLVLNHYFNLFSNKFALGISSSDFYGSIQQEFRNQLRLLEEMSPVQMVVTALEEAVDNAFLKLADEEYDFRQFNFDGFISGDQLYIITSRFENVIENFAQKNNYGLKFDTNLKEALNAKNIMEKIGNAFNIKYSKNRMVDPKRPRMYIFYKGVLKNE